MLKLNRDGHFLLNNFEDKCGLDIVRRAEETTTQILERFCETITDYVAWFILTYDTEVLNVLDKWATDSRRSNFKIGNEIFSIQDLRKETEKYLCERVVLA